MASVIGATPSENGFVDKVRTMSAMTFSSGDSDYVQPFVLTDDEIYDCLTTAIDDFNSWPPALTDYTGDYLISKYSSVLLKGTQIYMLILLEFYEAGMYFTVSDGGHSITRNKFPQYQTLKNQLWGMYEKFISIRKQQIGMSNMGIRGQFSTLAAVPYNAYKGMRATRFSLYGSTRRNTR